MAEALGVAGSVVGIVSLGIQLTQGLLKYYGSWRDQDNVVEDMCISLANLSGSLTVLEKALQAPAKFDKSVKESVEKNINAMYGTMRKLEDELRKVRDTESPKVGVRSAMRRHVRRAFYPFREETLSKIQRGVAEAHGNLDLTLQVLQICNVSIIRHDVHKLVRWQEDNEARNILGWLSSKNFWLQQADLSNQRQPGTGEWILEEFDFLEWAEGKKNTIWCLGGPGVGKTVLASAVVEFLERDLPVRGVALAFVYCNHKEILSQSIKYFVGAIVRQLVERKAVIPDYVHTLYKDHRGKGTNPTLTEYLDLLRSLAKECSEVYIVIDALDECVEEGGQPIWSELITKLQESMVNLNLLYTSRDMDISDTVLRYSTAIPIRATETDIRTYAKERLQSKNFLLQFCQQDSTLQEDILRAVISNADGMFLAVRLHLESLTSKTNPRAVRKALDKLPTTLYGNYDDAMERIKQQHTEELALRVLSWIVYAARPLRLKEVQHAIAIDELEPDDRSISEESLTPPSILINACAGMIKIDEASNIIGLVHKTTQEYFDQNGPKLFPHAHSDIGTRCLKYLSLEVFSDGACDAFKLYQRRLSENVLLEYAAQNLGYHMYGMDEHTLNNLRLDFFLDENKISCATQAFFVGTAARSEEFFFRHNFPRHFGGVHYAAYFGLKDIIRLLLVNPKVNPDTKDHYGRTPLSWAAANGHEAVVKLLLETGRADVNLRDQYNKTPLLLATEIGHEAMVKLLLEMGKVDINSKDSFNRTPLSLAAENGHEAVVKLLLETGKVEVNLKGGGRTPLSLAAENGHEAVVKLLLETGKVEVNLKYNPWNGTPLSIAAKNGHKAVVKLLLETGKVDVDSKDGYYNETPLSLAAKNGHEAVVTLLLEIGKVDINSENKHHQTPLSLAAENGHEAVVKLLLGTGKVDIDSKRSRNNQTPLLYAAARGNKAVVKLLLETGNVDINLKGGIFNETPLVSAVENGHEAVVKLLLETGKVDINLKDRKNQTPLSLAAENGREAVVKLLLETGRVDINSTGGHHDQTPLSLAAKKGHEAIVTLLREKGAK